MTAMPPGKLYEDGICFLGRESQLMLVDMRKKGENRLLPFAHCIFTETYMKFQCCIAKLFPNKYKCSGKKYLSKQGHLNLPIPYIEEL